MKKIPELNPDTPPDTAKLRETIDELDRLAAEGRLTQAAYDRIFASAVPRANRSGQFLGPILKRNPSGVRWITRKGDVREK